MAPAATDANAATVNSSDGSTRSRQWCGTSSRSLTVGFAAESRKLETYADEKRRRKKVNLIVANLAQNAIGADDNEVMLLDDSGTHKLPRAPKETVAKDIVARIATLYRAAKKRR